MSSNGSFFHVQHHASGRAVRMAPMVILTGAPSPSPQQRLLPWGRGTLCTAAWASWTMSCSTPQLPHSAARSASRHVTYSICIAPSVSILSASKQGKHLHTAVYAYFILLWTWAVTVQAAHYRACWMLMNVACRMRGSWRTSTWVGRSQSIWALSGPGCFPAQPRYARRVPPDKVPTCKPSCHQYSFCATVHAIPCNSPHGPPG